MTPAPLLKLEVHLCVVHSGEQLRNSHQLLKGKHRPHASPAPGPCSVVWPLPLFRGVLGIRRPRIPECNHTDTAWGQPSLVAPVVNGGPCHVAPSRAHVA